VKIWQAKMHLRPLSSFWGPAHLVEISRRSKMDLHIQKVADRMDEKRGAGQDPEFGTLGESMEPARGIEPPTRFLKAKCTLPL
jgi:hypothetical protein